MTHPARLLQLTCNILQPLQMFQTDLFRTLLKLRRPLAQPDKRFLGYLEVLGVPSFDIGLV